MNHHTLYKHHVNRDNFGRPKREGLAYIRNLAQQKFDFQSSKGFKSQGTSLNLVLGQIASPWATVPDYSNYQSMSALGGSAD